MQYLQSNGMYSCLSTPWTFADDSSQFRPIVPSRRKVVAINSFEFPQNFIHTIRSKSLTRVPIHAAFGY